MARSPDPGEPWTLSPSLVCVCRSVNTTPFVIIRLDVTRETLYIGVLALAQDAVSSRTRNLQL